MNNFTFVAPMYNASKTLERMLHSLAGQSYENWNLILIDDLSNVNEFDACVKIIDSFSEKFSKKITLIKNDTKQWEVANVLKGISLCNDDSIVCRIDADDYLSDLDALRIIDVVYREQNPDALWTAHRWFDDNQITNMNISGNLPQDADPYRYAWVSSHLKTFRKRMINDVKDENFRGIDGEYIKRAGDQCIYLPVLKRAKKRLFLPMVMYSYKCDLSPSNFQTADSKFQKEEAEFLRQRGFIE